MLAKDFLVVNSFARKPFGGNPAAVFTDAAGLDDSTMQSIARQMNLVESVFVFPSLRQDADFRFRYFTPTEELPVAGHPTVAAVVALFHDGAISPPEESAYRLDTGAGIRTAQIRVGDGGPSVIMEQQEPLFLPVVTERGHVAAALGLCEEDLDPHLPIQPIDTGLGHLVVPVKSLDALMRVQRKSEPLKSLCQGLGVREAQVFTFETLDPDCAIHTRNICPREGIEDPGCGVGNAALGAYLMTHWRSQSASIDIEAEQGTVVDMPCVIEIHGSRENGRIRVSIGGGGRVMMRGVFYVD